MAGKEEDFYPIDYRVYAPDVDGKTKNDHFQEMFVNALDQKHLQARTILFDGWYASAENLEANSPPQADLLHHTEEQSLGESEQGARLYSSKSDHTTLGHSSGKL